MAQGDILRVAEDQALEAGMPESYVEVLRELAILSETRDLDDAGVEKYLLQVALQVFKRNYYDWVKRKASGYVYDGLITWSLEAGDDPVADAVAYGGATVDEDAIIEYADHVLWDVADPQLYRSHYVLDVQTAMLVLAVSDEGEGAAIQRAIEWTDSVPTEISGQDGWVAVAVFEDVRSQIHRYVDDAAGWIEDRLAELEDEYDEADDPLLPEMRTFIDQWSHDLEVSEGWRKEG